MSVETARLPWHGAGDIVLIAEKDDTGIQPHSRIYRHILDPSPVFRDMLAMPQPTDAEYLDGCPVVRIPDPAGDLSAILSALQDGLSAMHDENRLTLDVLLRILRMSTKYQMDKLRRGTIQLLRQDWPLKHSDYIARRNLFGSPGPRVLESTRLIKVARECDVPELLPTAFYELSASRVGDWNETEQAGVRDLSPADLVRLVLGREGSVKRLRMLGAQNNEINLPRLWSRDGSAQGSRVNRGAFGHCEKTRLPVPPRSCLTIYELLRNMIGAQTLAGEPLYTVLDKVGRQDIAAAGACTPCVDWFTAVLANKQQELWESIPVDFDLRPIDSRLYDESIFKSL